MGTLIAVTIILALIGAGTVLGWMRDGIATCLRAGEED